MSYRPAFILRNGHIQSIYPSLFRKPPDLDCHRSRIDTPDGDFLDLDWYKRDRKRLVIISHGLEGHSRRPYVIGMAHYAVIHKWDVLAWNYRGCSDIPNNHPHSYHSGKTEDLALVIQHALTHNYEEIALIGFSIGGNKTLLHLGREHNAIPKELIAAVAFSVPCDLTSSSAHLAQFSHRIYMLNFLKSFKEKFKLKQSKFSEVIDLNGFNKIKTFKEFDERYTAPLNGFKNAEDYWQKSSCIHHLDKIQIPSLIVSALDDPFLPHECYPIEQAAQNKFLKLEIPKYGGHVGFMPEHKKQAYYSEKRAILFLNQFSQFNN